MPKIDCTLNSNVSTELNKPLASAYTFEELFGYYPPRIRHNVASIAEKLFNSALTACFLQTHLVSDSLFNVRIVLFKSLSCSSCKIFILGKLDVRIE